MMFWTLYLYELKKIFSNKLKPLVLIAVAAFLFFASAQRYFGVNPETNAWKAEHLLDGRIMDEDFFAELCEDSNPDPGAMWRYAKRYARMVFYYNESQSIYHSSVEQESWTADVFYDTRKRVIGELADEFYLTRAEHEYWERMEETIPKPFTYRSAQDIENLRTTYQFTMTVTCMLIAVFLAESFAGETESKMDALIYSSKYGHKYTVAVKLATGCTFSLVMGSVMLLMTHLPVLILSGLHGLDAPWYMVMQFSNITMKAWQMLLLHTLVYLLGCMLAGLLVMMLSLFYDRSMAAAGTIFMIVLFDLFGNVPTHMRVLSQIRYLTPITILLNSEIPDMRLTKLFGRFLISFQTAPILYVLVGLLLIIMTVRIFRRRYG